MNPFAAYDAEQRRDRGVYYTPQPVVSFIVKNVDQILIDEFGLEDGLADTITWGQMGKKRPALQIPIGVSIDEPFVQILDPATGTGTFLVEVIDLIYKKMREKWHHNGLENQQINEQWKKYVSKHLLPRFYGFEIMMASYVIAHMKIGLKLKETGFLFSSKDKMNVILTNTLEEAHDSDGIPMFLEFVGNESQIAGKIKKDTPITVIIGNPPYSVSSNNKTKYIEDLMAAYKQEIKNERNIQPLSDDYIKFIRYAQSRIERVNHGVVGIITNNSFLSGRIHRGMRKCLKEAFSEVEIIDLHGDGRTALSTDVKFDGNDENVFSILQGVSISLLRRGLKRDNEIYYFSYPGTRNCKYKWLLSANKDTKKCYFGDKLEVNSPYYFFKKIGFEYDEYSNFTPIDDLFYFYNVSGKPGQDDLLVSFEKEEVIPKLVEFLAEYKNGTISKLTEAGKKIVNRSEKKQFDEKRIIKYAYRPFDTRLTYYEPQMWTRSGYNLFNHVSNKPILLTTKIVKDSHFSHAFVTKNFPDVIFLSATSSVNCYAFPLSGNNNEKKILSQDNINTGKISKLLHRSVSSIEFFNYIYCVLFSPSYRKRYCNSLRYNFPRIPLVNNKKLFMEISEFGAELVSLHLMEKVIEDSIKPYFIDNGRNITKVGEKNKKLANIVNERGRLYINEKSYFNEIPIDVWNCNIGGYQVCYKWLADRRKAKRHLSDDDIKTYQSIVGIISVTLNIMSKVDSLIEDNGGWPDAFITEKENS